MTALKRLLCWLGWHEWFLQKIWNCELINPKTNASWGSAGYEGYVCTHCRKRNITKYGPIDQRNTKIKAWQWIIDGKQKEETRHNDRP